MKPCLSSILISQANSFPCVSLFLPQKKEGAQTVTITKYVLNIRIGIGKSELSRGKINHAYVQYCVSCKLIAHFMFGLGKTTPCITFSFFAFIIYFALFANPAAIYPCMCFKIDIMSDCLNINHWILFQLVYKIPLTNSKFSQTRGSLFGALAMLVP